VGEDLLVDPFHCGLALGQFTGMQR